MPKPQTIVIKRIAHPRGAETIGGSRPILAFDFKNTAHGEIHGVGLDADLESDINTTFKLYGTQDYGLTNFNDYAASAPNWKHYEIPVGQYYTGMQLYLFFANDQDVPNLTVESYFSNVVIFSQPPTAVPTNTNTPTYTSTVTATSTYTPTATFTPTTTATFILTPTFTPSATFTPTALSWRLGNYRPDAYGVKANISAPSQGLYIQEGGESNWVSLPTPYWVQAGWRYYKGWIWAWSYVESYSPTTGYEIREYSIHNWGDIIEYKVEWNSNTSTWCGWINGVNKACYDAQPAPITVSARSEVHVSSQNELNTYFWTVSYLDSNGYWTVFDQALWQESPPYVIDKTQFYDFHNYGP